MSRSLAGLVLAAGLMACSNLTFEERQELRFAESKWESRGFGDYSIEVSRGCFCPPEWTGWARVDVRGGEIVRVTLLADGSVVPALHHGFWPTVDELFERIRETENRVEFEIDDTLGYPTVIRWIAPSDVLDAGGIDRLRNAAPLP